MRGKQFAGSTFGALRFTCSVNRCQEPTWCVNQWGGKSNYALEHAPQKPVYTEGNEGLSYRALVFFLGGRGLVVLTRPVPWYMNHGQGWSSTWSFYIPIVPFKKFLVIQGQLNKNLATFLYLGFILNWSIPIENSQHYHTQVAMLKLACLRTLLQIAYQLWPTVKWGSEVVCQLSMSLLGMGLISIF